MLTIGELAEETVIHKVNLQMERDLTLVYKNI
jgi:hypothetical protein